MLVKKLKEFYLLLLGLTVLVIYLNLPANKKWYKKNVTDAWGYFEAQKNYLDEEDRKVGRFGTYYTISKQVADWLVQHANKEEILLLIPPTDYFKQNGVDYRVPEPAVFYYFTGIKTIWPNSPDAATANWYLRVVNKRVVIEKVSGAISLADTIAAFNKFPCRL